jgi:hypothetical protein
MDDRFEATFVVSVDADEVWSVLAKGRRSDNTWWLPGFDTVAEVTDVDEGRRLQARKVEQPCAGTEIVVTVEDSATGTTVTVVQSGFGKDFFAQALDALSIGWSFIVADVMVYLELGIDGGRHMRPWAALGCNVHETPAGLVVDAVWGGFAQRAGIAPGDLLLSVAGAPVLTRRELETVMRIVPTGDEIEATWAHDRELRRTSAAL